MRIAIVSYEHPLGFAGGGIATYTGQLASMLADRGHDVEVFTATKNDSASCLHQGCLVHLINAQDTASFRFAVVAPFQARHQINGFDVIEAAEYGADAIELGKKYPEVPLVVKLHTPAYLAALLNGGKISFVEKLRFIVGGLRRGKFVKPFWTYHKENDPEYLQTKGADAVCSPSASLAVIVQDAWRLKKEIVVLPNIFTPSKQLLQIPVAAPSPERIVIGFFGRLEQRKGILDLVKAIPSLLRVNPNLTFRFVGKPHPSPKKGLDMETYIREQLSEFSSKLEFLGYQPYDRIAELLAGVDICVFPSIWENFPNVCLEAMAAGRAVVASNSGGMAEMITHEHEGLLVPPMSPDRIISAVSALADNPQRITVFGAAARSKVVEFYNAQRVGQLVEAFYHCAIKRRKLATAPPPI